MTVKITVSCCGDCTGMSLKMETAFTVTHFIFWHSQKLSVNKWTAKGIRLRMPHVALVLFCKICNFFFYPVIVTEIWKAVVTTIFCSYCHWSKVNALERMWYIVYRSHPHITLRGRGFYNEVWYYIFSDILSLSNGTFDESQMPKTLFSLKYFVTFFKNN
jgi:hypothetical protein